MSTRCQPEWGESSGFGSQLVHSLSDDCEQVASLSDIPFPQELVKIGIGLFTVLVWPGLVMIFIKALG